MKKILKTNKDTELEIIDFEENISYINADAMANKFMEMDTKIEKLEEFRNTQLTITLIMMIGGVVFLFEESLKSFGAGMIFSGLANLLNFIVE